MVYNKAILMGNLTRDPEVRYTPNGTAVASFTLALNYKYKQGSNIKEEVSFIDVVAFGKQAENLGQYIKKGDAVLVDGRLQQRRWETEDGQKKSKVEVVAQSVTFMPKRNNTKMSGASDVPEEMPMPYVSDGGDDDIPF